MQIQSDEDALAEEIRIFVVNKLAFPISGFIDELAKYAYDIHRAAYREGYEAGKHALKRKY